MSEFGVTIVSANIGALSNANRPIFKVPTAGGGITVLGANAVLGTAGTCGLYLVDLGTAGTAIAGTIATLGSAVYTLNTPKAFTVSTAFVDAGHFVGVKEDNSGAGATVTIVDVEYVMGK